MCHVMRSGLLIVQLGRFLELTAVPFDNYRVSFFMYCMQTSVCI